MPTITAMKTAEIGGLWSETSPRQKCEIFKKKKKKLNPEGLRNLTQAVEHLPSKSKAFDSSTNLHE
jgi:hypothetical protein